MLNVLFSIADQSQFWDLGSVNENAEIVLNEETDSLTQNWVLQAVPSQS
jgi:hypothetical protein